MRNAEQLRMACSQMEMLLGYCMGNLAPASQSLSNPYTDKLEAEIDKHELSNYDDNLPAKLLRVWEQLIRPVGDGAEGYEGV